jgi:hypothetical protein
LLDSPHRYPLRRGTAAQRASHRIGPRTYSPVFKTKVVMESISGRKTIQENPLSMSGNPPHEPCYTSPEESRDAVMRLLR